MTEQHPDGTGTVQTVTDPTGDPPRTGGATTTGAVRHRYRMIAVAVSGCLLVGVVASATLPVVLVSRSEEAATSLATQLTAIAEAEDVYRDAHGTYTDVIDELAVPTTAHHVAVVHAGPDGYCVGAYDDSTGTALFYSSVDGLTDSSCG